MRWMEGATEAQDYTCRESFDIWGDSDEEVELTEVESYEVTVTKFRAIK